MAIASRAGPLGERNFLLLWIGQTASAFGDRVAPIHEGSATHGRERNGRS